MPKQTKESRKIARISLIIMGIGFLSTLPFQGSLWVDLIQGGFEAGLVGGLADWFAVTALFRHPLGLRIPHTALLPNNRQRMTHALVSTLKNDWLSKESIHEKVKHIHFTDKLIVMLEKEIQTERFRKNLIVFIKKMIGSLDAEKMTPFVKKQIESALTNIELSKFIPLVSSHLLSEQVDKKALDYGLKKAEIWLSKGSTIQQLGTISMNVLNKIEVDGFLQFALKSVQNLMTEEKMGKLVRNLLLSGVNSLKHEHEPNRQALLLYIQKEITGLNDNQELIDGIEKWKTSLIATWEPDQAITESLQKVQHSVLQLIEEDTFTDTYFMPMMNHLVEIVKENSPKIDNWIQEQITVLVENNHSKIGDLVQENLDKLDNETLIDMMENKIGKDLQWIRVNGAVCGFIIGLFLTGIQILF
ncbi:DUF445 domain-containing protein [Neobacillus sp. LXY-4]|uniref:DUF445 domain-containing protein n=1 Tax=Neobacillus sp. LXY-4 TaxID=3379826 RepID=UPI003EE0297F